MPQKTGIATMLGGLLCQSACGGPAETCTAYDAAKESGCHRTGNRCRDHWHNKAAQPSVDYGSSAYCGARVQP